MLSGSSGFDPGLVQKVAGLDSLFLLPSGPRAPDPAELLCSRKLEQLLEWLRRGGFHHIIVDSPPVLPVTDSTILSTLVDGVIMVVACESTSRAALNRACRVVEHSGGRILGTVFNKVDDRRDGYSGYRYYHGYSRITTMVTTTIKTVSRRRNSRKIGRSSLERLLAG